MQNLLSKLKQYWTQILEALLLIMAGVVYFLKSRKDSAEAIVDNQETIKQVNEIEKKIDVNEAQLAAEEKKRKELEKANQDAKSSDSTDFLAKR